MPVYRAGSAEVNPPLVRHRTGIFAFPDLFHPGGDLSKSHRVLARTNVEQSVDLERSNSLAEYQFSYIKMRMMYRNKYIRPCDVVIGSRTSACRTRTSPVAGSVPPLPPRAIPREGRCYRPHRPVKSTESRVPVDRKTSPVVPEWPIGAGLPTGYPSHPSTQPKPGRAPSSTDQESAGPRDPVRP